MPTYKAFGLNISSDLPCPELLSSYGDADIHVVLGTIPACYAKDNDLIYFWSATPHHFYLSLKNIGRFLCEGGNKITVEPFPYHNPDLLRIYLFGSVFGALMHQRETFPLHASAVERDGVSIAFTGDTGAGKSTLASAYLQNGYRLLSDDVCLVTRSPSNILVAHPSYPLIKLSQDMIDRLQLKETIIGTPSLYTPKLRLSVSRFSHNTCEFKNLIVLSSESAANSQLKISKLQGIEKIQAILKNIYRYEYINPMMKEKQLFEYCLLLSRHINVFLMTGQRDQHHPCHLIREVETFIL